MKDYIAAQLEAHGATWERTMASLQPVIADAASLLVETLANGGRVLLCGNGGSAADAQHIGAELVGHFGRAREGHPAIALNADTSILTSVANDLGYEEIFARQVRALGRAGDLLIAISTSGTSENVVRAARAAAEMQCRVLGWTGGDGGDLAAFCDVVIAVPSEDTQRVQEMHVLIGHILCGIVERRTPAT